MIVVGLTGGIGSGKSTVAAALEQRGAAVIDADAVARELQEPGAPLFDAMVHRFGQRIIGPDGRLDRPAIAAMVFPDPELLEELNALTHPVINARVRERMLSHLGSDRVVVLDVPLLIEKGSYPIAGIVVVDVPVEIAVDRLVRFRLMDEADARARVARQATREERVKKADYVVDNSGTPTDLATKIPALWDWILTLEPVPVTDVRWNTPGRA